MLSETHRLILRLMLAGEKLRTNSVPPEIDAWIGATHIPATLIGELEAAKLIRCREFRDRGLRFGKECDYELTAHGSEMCHEPSGATN